ncbi:MAG: DUF1800 domain-containing protein [Bacteroidia bacterium]|nr:DUF1800 domain-containing protein [Bacteroidia bacterium]
MTSCNVSSLSIFIPSAERPWNAERVNHVLRRLSFGGTTSDITAALNLSPEQFIDSLVDQALAIPPSAEPSWNSWTYQDYINAGLDFDEETQNNHLEWGLQTYNDMLDHGLKGRLTMFWHNHFVTELDVYYCSNYMYRYYNVLQTYALGNFSEFVRAIGKSEAMLLYLNGFENSLYNANENYARELYELFTLGENNGYTQADIVETSKALTGYNHWNDFCDYIYFDQSSFNTSDKTIFGQTGNWDYDDVIDILFQEKSDLIANFICRKLYTYFVSPNVNETIVSELASIFVVDFDIANVLRILFKSEHFFDSLAIGTLIKSPYDLTNNVIKTLNFSFDDNIKLGVIYLNGIAGQSLYNPVDVAGWQGNHDWINSSTLTARWEILNYIIVTAYNIDPEVFRTFAIESSNNSNDPYLVTKSIIDRFVPKALHTVEDYETATDVFKYDVPSNYFDDGSWNLSWDVVPIQVGLLLLHIIKMPEFQLK